MSTTKRPLIDGAAYHIISRGNRKLEVFHEKDDIEHFLATLLKYKRKYKFKVYSYCIMNNHFHLILDPIESKNLRKIMHSINLSYARWYNIKYEICGHLWQGRYKSCAIQKDQYLLNCINYIEYNPVRANICSRPENYPWSSYKSRICFQKNRLLDQLLL